MVTVLVLPFALVIGSLIALLIMLDSPGPIFYRAVRVGKHGKTFHMLKFRKMLRSATGMPLTMANDERFTPIGQFLALTKLDELPQLWNVLRGEMRLVGPRPEDVDFVDRYRDRYAEILSVVPGITGPAAVQFASESRLLADQRDPLRYYAEQLMPLKIDIDIAYTRQRTVAGDMRILAMTMLVPALRVVRRLRSRSRARRRHIHVQILTGGGTVLMVLFAIASFAGL
ncbi:MAG: putative glycosyltransferase [Solirubrobacterales bacterium]|nr:putative glycosyltransferase [Solirubrobacterales bacterium]